MTTPAAAHAPAAPDVRARQIQSMVRWMSWGSLIPVLGWLHGVSMLWSDGSYSRRDKVLGTLLFPGGWFGAMVAVLVLAKESSGYCYSASVGAVGGPMTVETGCEQLGALSPPVSLVLTGAVLLAAAIGPHYIARRGRPASRGE